MFVTVTQVLPPERTVWNDVNLDLVERVLPYQDGLMLVMQSGAQVQIIETREQWNKLVVGA
jgi:hypothetical protein